MHRSIATVSMSGTLREKLEAIAAARFDGFELFENDFVHFAGSARDLRAMSADLDLAIDLYQPLRDFEGMPEAQHLRNLERAERKFDLMQELGVPMVLVCSNTSPARCPSPSARRRSCASWPSARPGATCASATKRWPGGATSSCTARPGTSSSASIIRTSA